MEIIQHCLFDGKVCNDCGRWKFYSEYRGGYKYRDGFYRICKKCQYMREKQSHAPKKEERKQQTKDWHRANKEQYDAGRRKWRKLNKEQVNKLTQRRRALIRGNGGSYTSQEWDALCAKYHYLCLCCGKAKPLTPDHIVPVTRGGSSYIDNIQPLCMLCNQRKKDKTIDYR